MAGAGRFVHVGSACLRPLARIQPRRSLSLRGPEARGRALSITETLATEPANTILAERSILLFPSIEEALRLRKRIPAGKR